MSAHQQRLAALRTTIPELTPSAARVAQEQGAVLVDVREPDEVIQGSPAGAKRIVRGYLELSIEDEVPDLERPLITLCAGGARSLFAADDLRRMGYRNVSSVAGGFTAWKNAGLPVESPRVLTSADRERYGRHLMVPEIGEEGQLALLASKVLLVGAGGLGSPCALYLAAAGVGTLGLVDGDFVDRSNLQRQILHRDQSVGESKVVSARQTIEALNPTIKVVGYDTRLHSGNVEEIFAGYEVVVDGTDNFAARYLINDACVRLGLPNVHASVFRFEGQISVFWRGRGPCYRCVYPEPPPAEMAPSCAEAGVLGVLPGVMGLLQAVETLKILLRIGDPLIGQLLQYDALDSSFTRLRLERDPHCRYCAEGAVFPGYVDIAASCPTAAGS